MDPIRAYHATNAPEDFDRFEFTDDLGYHFGSPEAANERARHLIEDGAESCEFLRIIPCTLHIQAPLRLSDCFTWGVQDTLSALRAAGVLTAARHEELAADGYLDQEMFRELVEKAGYDSIVYSNQTESGGDSWMVLDPERVTFTLSPSETGLQPMRVPRP